MCSNLIYNALQRSNAHKISYLPPLAWAVGVWLIARAYNSWPLCLPAPTRFLPSSHWGWEPLNSCDIQSSTYLLITEVSKLKTRISFVERQERLHRRRRCPIAFSCTGNFKRSCCSHKRLVLWRLRTKSQLSSGKPEFTQTGSPW